MNWLRVWSNIRLIAVGDLTTMLDYNLFDYERKAFCINIILDLLFEFFDIIICEIYLKFLYYCFVKFQILFEIIFHLKLLFCKYYYTKF